ncbi:MAG: arsenate reductase family protein [Gemmatimonadota bacterium]
MMLPPRLIFMEVQIFGTRKDAETRKALRYFAERRIRTHFVDLVEKAASRGELGRFAQKFGVQALVDREGKEFRELGLGTALYSEERWLERLVANPGLLKTPLVRCGKLLTIGVDEAIWNSWRGS